MKPENPTFTEAAAAPPSEIVVDPVGQQSPIPEHALRALAQFHQRVGENPALRTRYALLDRAIYALIDKVAGCLPDRVAETTWKRLSTQNDNTLLAGVVETLLDADPVVDKRERLRLQGRTAFRQLLESHGGTYTSEEIAGMQGISSDAIRKRVRRGQLLAIRQGERWLFPVWQFAEDGSLVPHFRDILALLGTTDPVAQVRFFLSPDPDLGMMPIEALRKGVDYPLVERRARQFGEQMAT